MWGAVRSQFLGRQRECRAVVVGLDGAGKTSIVSRLKNGHLDEKKIISTVGFNVECVEYRKMIFSLWDLGGSADARSFWHLYYPDTQAIIFVVDCHDIERLVEARHELHRMLAEYELWDAPLLVYANKQDLPHAKKVREVAEVLNLFSLSTRNWHIVDTQATHADITDANLHAGLDWLMEVLLMSGAQRQLKAKLEYRKHNARGPQD
ncbi:hypothetical protein AB1Y20_002809 [Prymnesium parvum]|uniref:ADP-ribosylation factor-like protein 6 n=1 Tax=Prymnesium parvum TaxID=97485 RepID=A0AB34J907_PRYPA